MTDAIKRCPDCRETLESTMERSPLSNGMRPNGYYVEEYVCPNRNNHGSKVPCSNGCGEQVDFPSQHFVSHAPAIDHHWTCIPLGSLQGSVG